jgi:predicted AAA+ superfamily ATPase
MTASYTTMIRRFLTTPTQSFFLMGPRGSGKSTWLRSQFPSAYVIDLLSEEKYQQLLANPALFADLSSLAVHPRVRGTHLLHYSENIKFSKSTKFYRFFTIA